MDLDGCRRFAIVALFARATAGATPPTPSPVAQAQAEVDALLAHDVAAWFEAGQRDGLERCARDWEAARAQRRDAAQGTAAPAPDPFRRSWTPLRDEPPLIPPNACASRARRKEGWREGAACRSLSHAPLRCEALG